MTEAARVVRLLARRLSASRRYGDEDVTVAEGAGSYILRLPLIDAEVFLYVDVEEDKVRGVLSFLLYRDNKGSSTHLNNWFRSKGDEGQDVPTLTTRVWAKLWEHEEENREVGRVLWMHGPDLPWLEEDVPEDPAPLLKEPSGGGSVFDLFGA